MHSRCVVHGNQIRSIYLLRRMCTSREYVYYIGPLKGSIWNAGSQKCCKITWKIGGWMEEMLQIACKYEAGHQKCCNCMQNWGAGAFIWGPIPRGGWEHRDTGPYYIYIYFFLYIHIYICIYISPYSPMKSPSWMIKAQPFFWVSNCPWPSASNGIWLENRMPSSSDFQ